MRWLESRCLALTHEEERARCGELGPLDTSLATTKRKGPRPERGPVNCRKPTVYIQYTCARGPKRLKLKADLLKEPNVGRGARWPLRTSLRGQVSASLPPPSSYGYAKAHMVQYSVGESRTRACPPTCPSLAFTFLAKPRSLDKNALWLATRVPLTCCAGDPARATARAAPMAPPQDVRHPPSTRGVTNADKFTLVAPFPRAHLVGTVLRPHQS